MPTINWHWTGREIIGSNPPPPPSAAGNGPDPDKLLSKRPTTPILISTHIKSKLQILRYGKH